MRHVLSIALLLMLAAGSALADQFSADTILTRGDSTIYIFRLDSSHAVDDFSMRMSYCANAQVTVVEGSDVGLTFYSVSEADDTLSEIESATSVASHTGSTSSPATYNPGSGALRFVIDNAEDSGNTTEVGVVCSLDSYGSSSGSTGDWLVGGENGVTDASNPNDENGDGTFDDPIVCTLDPATCFYESSSGELFEAVSSNQVNTTVWARLNEELLYRELFDGSGFSSATGTYSTSVCVGNSGNIDFDFVYACGDYRTGFSLGGRVRLTRVISTPQLAIAGAEGGTFRLYDSSAGAEITGTEWSSPPSNASVTAYDPQETSLTGIIPAGAWLNWQVRDGDFCAAGSGCAISSVRRMVALLGYRLD